MHSFQARLYNGNNSKPNEIIVTVDSAGQVYIDERACGHFSELHIRPRIANIPRQITLPDGGQLESPDNELIDHLCQQWCAKKNQLPYLLESNMKVLLASLLFLLVGSYLFIQFGIPALSKQITERLPIAIDEQLSGQTIAQLDRTIFKSSQLESELQEKLQQRFMALTPDDPHQFQLLFRHSESIGANAFALPNGSIIITDEMVALSEQGSLIDGIFLHEIGHVVNRHSVQQLVRQAGLSILIVMISGDINTASNLVILMPTILLQAQYSRHFEREADDYAFREMQTRGMDTEQFASLMEKIQQGEEKGQGTGLAEYFSSHPPTAERIQRLRNLSPQ